MGRRLPLALLATAVALAASGGTVVVVRSSGAEGPPANPRKAVVEALARRPGDVAGSARYLVRYGVEARGVRRELGTYEGTADFERRRFLARGRIVADEGAVREFDVFVFGRWQYTRGAGERAWDRATLQPQNVGAPTPELTVVGERGDRLAAPPYAGDLDARRQIVDALVVTVGPEGREEHRGDPVWRYRVTVDGELAATLLPEPLGKEMRAWDEADDRRDIEVWLDGRGRLRRLSILYSDEQGLGFLVDNEFWDYGGPGRLDLPGDLGDPTAGGGEGVTSFTAPGVDLDGDSPGFVISVFDSEREGGDITLDVDDTPAPGAERRRRFFRMRPARGRPLEPGELRLVDVGEFNAGAPLTVDLDTPEVAARCPRRQPRSGSVTVVQAVRYQDRTYVRLHLRYTVRCQPPGGAPVTVSGEARYYALT